MPGGQRVRRGARRFTAADALPPSRPLGVRAGDGTALHAEVFGPEDGYPIVLAHGITCAIRVWGYQIADLPRDFRVIAYDHRGHGRSGVPTRRANYGLNFLAADLDAVLEATLKSGERAVIAGHSMVGIAITSWAERYPRRVADRFVELPGGHCTILERPDEVNAHLRRLVDSVGEEQRATS
jgi:pimeloyl-ACP methyl ester carboxylesterase